MGGGGRRRLREEEEKEAVKEERKQCVGLRCELQFKLPTDCAYVIEYKLLLGDSRNYHYRIRRPCDLNCHSSFTQRTRLKKWVIMNITS